MITDDAKNSVVANVKKEMVESMEANRFPEFSKRFRELRGDKTQAEFAEMIGVSRPTIGYYENGTRIPDALTLRQIAERCGVTTDYLVGLAQASTAENRDISAYTGLTDKSIQNLKSVSNTFISRVALNAILEDKRIIRMLVNYLCAFLEDERKKSRFRQVPLARILAGGYADSMLVRLIAWLPLWKQAAIEEIKNDKELFEKMLLTYVANLADDGLCRCELEGGGFNMVDECELSPEEYEAYLQACYESYEAYEADEQEDGHEEYEEERLEQREAIEEVLSELDRRKRNRYGNNPEAR